MKGKPDIVCFRPKQITGKTCGNCGWVRDQGLELRCRNPKSAKTDNAVNVNDYACSLYQKDRIR